MSNMKCPNIKIYKCSDGFVTDNAQVAKSHEANIKSNKLICPFCQQELNSVAGTVDCTNFDCIKTRGWYGNKELWQELIRTRKALDVALDGLTTIGGYLDYNDCVGIALDTKDEIYKILEQKDVK